MSSNLYFATHKSAFEIKFFTVGYTVSHWAQRLFSFFCQLDVFLLVVLTTAMITLAEKFLANFLCYCKLPPTKPLFLFSEHSLQASGELIISRKLTQQGMCLKASASRRQKFLFCVTKHCFLFVVCLSKLKITFWRYELSV